MSRQNWSTGQTVNVGFLKGLTVLEKIPTPGDQAPDAYVLMQAGHDANSVLWERFYRFVPHKGIARCASIADARRA